MSTASWPSSKAWWMRSHIAASLLVGKLWTCTSSSVASVWSAWSMSANVTVPYWTGSRLPNMLWLTPCGIRIFFMVCSATVLSSAAR
jgi:hypothetical protein